MSLNKKIFFDTVRGSLYRNSLSSAQVDGLETILTEAVRRSVPRRHLSYMFATGHLETDATMQPIKEHGGQAYFMRMYDKTGSRPKVAATLGNTAFGDGALFAGRGYVQLTGRRNYDRASKATGVDLLSNPDLAMRPDLASIIMFDGMKEGWFTGKKLSDYIGPVKTDYTNARRIINGTDRAAEIAGFAVKFEDALVRSDY